jgi:predicted ATPase
MLSTLAVANYRSLRQLVVPLADLIVLHKQLGETQIEGQGLLEIPSWKWPSR